MARTFNRRPVSVNGPDKDNIKNYTFNYEQWKGINDSKDFLAVDQMTFSDAQNMYIDSEGLLSSRPPIKKSAAEYDNIMQYQEFSNDIKDTTIRVYLRQKSKDIDAIYVHESTSGVGITFTHNDSPMRFVDTYKLLYIFKGDNSMIVYDKTLSRFLIETEIEKLIYVPVTKTFTGSAVNDGEDANELTTSAKYLYYYSDVNGINSDAIGKTLEWDGKTINWNDNMRTQLVKDHYDIGDSTIVTVGVSGAVAWVSNNVLVYAVNGAVVYSWDISTIVPVPDKVKRISFNPTADTISIDIGSGGSVTAYIVSCLAVNESGTLKYPQPVDIRTALSISTETFKVYMYKFYDDGQYCLIGMENQQIVAYVKFADSEQMKLIASGTIYPLAVDMNSTYMALLYSSSDESNSYYKVQIYTPKTSTTAIRTDTYQFALNSISKSADNVGFAVDANNYYAYLPQLPRTGQENVFVNYYAARASLTESQSVTAKTIASGFIEAISPVVFTDNYNKFILKNKVYDITTIKFTDTNEYAAAVTSIDGIGLPSTVNVYNYYKIVDNSYHVFTRFSDDTFELYYTVPGTIQDLDVFDVLYLNNYFFAVGNKLYITEDRYNDDGEFLFYLPKKNVNEFDNVITKLHQIDESTIAVFFDNEIYYTTYDSDVGTYRYYKSKLQFGLRKGSNVITSDDSVTTYFPTDRGIMALTYQNFIASSEQATTPISDPVFNYMKDFLKGKVVKLYKKDFWIAAYNGSNMVWLLDIRNGSWWRQELPAELLDIWTRNNEPWLNLGETYSIDKTGEYTDDGKPIEWFFQSQKLHLSALNYYKSVQALTFFGVSDDNVCVFNLDTYAYRDNIYENAAKSIEYGINMIRTYLYHLHVMKLHEFQFKAYADTSINDPELIHPIKLSNVAVRYRVSREVR